MSIRRNLIIALPLSLALAACGRSEKATTDAQPDTVEIPADEALQNVPDQPVADPSANAALPSTETTTSAAEQKKIQEAGDNAAQTAAAAADAMGSETTTEQKTQQQ